MPDPSFAAIFDLDGLLADTEIHWTESARLLLGRRGHTFDLALKRTFSGRHPLEVVQRMIAHYGLDDEPRALLEERLQLMREIYRTREIRPLPGAVELVAALEREAVPMAVASGSPSFLLEVVLERLGLREPLRVHVGSDAVTRGKPAPDLFLLAAERLGVPPRACTVLEDSIAGVQAALAAGMAAVAVPGPGVPDEAIAGAHLVVRSLTELSPGRLAELVARRCA